VILVDSSVWIEHLNGQGTDAVGRLRRLIGRQPLLVGDLILCEVLRGVRSEAQAREVETRLRQFELISLADPELAFRAAANYRHLRSQGFTVRATTIDLIIGTFCIERGHALLHSDRDFEPMERFLGLKTP
jgi:predicted nucleic acid-binding protein